MSNFEDLGLIAPLLKAVKDKGYTTPSPIQVQAIPVVLQNRDVLGSAETGTGKTAAFAIPIIQNIVESPMFRTKRPFIQSLIITPTRELANQIDQSIGTYAKYTKLKHTVVYGGVKQYNQVSILNRGVHILTATPGRLLDLYNQGVFSLDGVETLVLDEADRMLDMGFIHDIRKIIGELPSKRQTLFFSATMPPNIVKLSQEILYKPTRISVARTSAPAEGIDQYVYFTNRSTKKNLLAHILDDPKIGQVLVFSRTKHGCDRLARDLGKMKIPCATIHGDRSQRQREVALDRFKKGSIRILVATDIAARGIDVKSLKYVINFDVPNTPETYIHRIGRSGRAGNEGVAISICEPEENVFIQEIEKLLGKKIAVVEDNPFPQTDKPRTKSQNKAWEKEKRRRKDEFFKNRKKGHDPHRSGDSRGRGGSGRSGGGRSSGSNRGRR